MCANSWLGGGGKEEAVSDVASFPFSVDSVEFGLLSTV